MNVDKQKENKMKNQMTRFFFTLPVALLISGQALANGASTSKVWEHHIEAWKRRDVSAIVADYTEDSVVILGNRVYRGQNAIREVFRRLFVTFDAAEVHKINPA